MLLRCIWPYRARAVLPLLLVGLLLALCPRPSSSDEKSVRLAFAGDCAFTGDLNETVKRGGYQPFGTTERVLRAADIAMVNLESVLAPPDSPARRHRPGAPILRGTPAAAKSLASAGIDVVSVANNHAFDRGAEGLRASLRALKNAGVRTVGAGMSPAAAIQEQVLEVRGLRIGFLAFTEFVNHPPDQGAAVARIRRTMTRRVQSLDARVDTVVVSVHWGDQFTTKVAPRQVWWAHKLVDAGADVVFGHHPHVLQGVEVHEGRAVLYSLGNFLWGRQEGKPAHSAIALVDVRSGSHPVRGFSLVPVLRHAPLGEPRIETGRAARFIRGGFISQSFRFGTRMSEREGILHVRVPAP